MRGGGVRLNLFLLGRKEKKETNEDARQEKGGRISVEESGESRRP